MTDTTSPVRIDDLIDTVARAHEAPLDRVGGAVQLSDQLGELADDLVGYFVDQARRSGATWSEIGGSMGVTKQAVQKRFVSRSSGGREPLDRSQGFSRFDAEARAAVVQAQELARTENHDVITIGHLVLAMVADRSSRAAEAISAQGVDLDEVDRIARATLPQPAATVPAMIPFDAHTTAALEHSFAVAQQARAEMVGAGHVLLAVLVEEDGTGVLAGLGIRPESVESFLGTEGLRS